MNNVKKLSIAGLLLAVALLLPFLTGQIPQIGSRLSPMHIPVLLCGFLCGWPYGLVTGAVAPMLRFVLFGMPPLFPTGLAMTFELAAYGACAGVFYALLPKKDAFVYVGLIAAMLAGRLVWGGAMLFLSLAANVRFDLSIFLAGAFVNAVPGIILHILVVPAIVIALKKARFLPNE